MFTQTNELEAITLASGAGYDTVAPSGRKLSLAEIGTNQLRAAALASGVGYRNRLTEKSSPVPSDPAGASPNVPASIFGNRKLQLAISARMKGISLVNFLFPPYKLPSLAGGVFLALAGCQQMTPTPVANAATEPAAAPPQTIFTAKKDVVQFASGDLQNAIARASAADPKAVPEAPMIVKCFTFLNAQLAVLQPPTTSASGGDVGLATSFVVADLALNNVTSATSPAMQAAYADACGGLIIYKQNKGIALGNQLASLAALIAR